MHRKDWTMASTRTNLQQQQQQPQQLIIDFAHIPSIEKVCADFACNFYLSDQIQTENLLWTFQKWITTNESVSPIVRSSINF